MLDAEHWRQRAEEMRKIAEGLDFLSRAKASILRTADEYDRLAARAEKRTQVATQARRARTFSASADSGDTSREHCSGLHRNRSSSTLVVSACAPHDRDGPKSTVRRNTTFRKIRTNAANAACSVAYMRPPTRPVPASHTRSVNGRDAPGLVSAQARL